MKTSAQIRQNFLDFWTSAPRNAQVVPNMSLVPNNDSTLLFVNSGMFPLAPYLGGQPHPLGKRLVDIQRCLRTNYDEMIEVGDNRHTLMFEMLGDWSLGDFFKAEQIPWILEFWVEVLELDPSRIYVSVFEGDEDAPRDDEAIAIWQKAFQKYGIDAEFSTDIYHVPESLEQGKSWKPRIFAYPKKKNWWERAHAPGELGGPTSEMFYDLGQPQITQDKYHINDDSGRFIEIGNNVFMQNRLDENLHWTPLPQKNIDFGGGFERVVMIVQGKTDIYETDIYMPIIEKIAALSGKSYKTDGQDNELTAAFRVIADHTRAATFIIADGVMPANKDQGYILRRFIRRASRFGSELGLEESFLADVAAVVIDTLKGAYPHLLENAKKIQETIREEEDKFNITLFKALSEFQHRFEKDGILIEDYISLSGEDAFYLYETYGLPPEVLLDELKQKNAEQRKEFPESAADNLMREFNSAEQKHRDNSRAGAEQKFKGGLADHSRETTKLHTAHHLLLAALQKIVDPNIKQRGSNITAERLRIDFNLDRKVTPEELQQVEDLVNEKINEKLPVTHLEMPKVEAEKLGAQMEFGAKYPEIVSVYVIGDLGKVIASEAKQSDLDGVFSIEFCGGPHVENTSELAEGGKKFKILKEESSSSGVRRIKATLI